MPTGWSPSLLMPTNRHCTVRQRGTRDIPSWLPAPAQGLIELDQREQFIPFGLRQAQLSVEQVTVGIQRIEQRIDAAPVAHVGELRAVLQRGHQQGLLGTDLFDAAI